MTSGINGLGGMPLAKDTDLVVPEESLSYPLVIWNESEDGVKVVCMYITKDGQIVVTSEEGLKQWAATQYEYMKEMNAPPVISLDDFNS